MKIVVGFCLFMCLISCGNSEENANKIEQDLSLPSLSKEQINKLRVTEYLLDPKVQVHTKSWAGYKELDGIIVNLKQANVTYFKGNDGVLAVLIKDLKEHIPEALDTPSIMSRLIAVETKLYKLESVVNLSNVNSESILDAIKEVLVSFSNLNIQMNKKLERDSQKIIKP